MNDRQDELISNQTKIAYDRLIGIKHPRKSLYFSVEKDICIWIIKILLCKDQCGIRITLSVPFVLLLIVGKGCVMAKPSCTS